MRLGYFGAPLLVAYFACVGCGGGTGGGDNVDGGDGAVIDPDAGVQRDAWLDTDADHVPIVDLHVEDHSGEARQSWPVSVGVPLPRGQHHDEALIGLADRPVQTRVLSRWSDGSIKFVLLDYQVDVAGSGQATQTVVARPVAPEPVAGNTVTETTSAITVDTGALRFAVSKDQLAFLSEVWLDLDGDGSYDPSEQIVSPASGQDHFYDLQSNNPDRPTVDYLARDLIGGTSHAVGNATPALAGGSSWMRPEGGGTETRLSAAADNYSAEVVEHGPYKTVIRLNGTFEPGADVPEYTLWIHAYRGKPYVRVQHSFVFKGDPQTTNIRRMGLSLPIGFGAAPQFSAAGRAGSLPLVAGDSAYLFSTGPQDVFHLVHQGFGLDWEAGVAGDLQTGIDPTQGWIDVTGDDFGVAVTVANMANLYPKELSYDVDSSALTMWMWPDHGGLVLDLRASVEPDGMEGVSFTHDTFYWFHGSDDAEGAPAMAARFSDSLQPYADPEWYGYRGTRAAGMIMPHDELQFPRTEAYLATRTAFVERSMTEFGWLGMLNYGDLMWAYKYNESGTELGTWGMADGSNDDSYAGWRRGNTMLSYRMLMQYLRTGNHRYWRAAEAHLKFVRDVLVKHHNTAEPDWVGLGRRHSAYWGAVAGRPGGVSMDGYGTNWLGHYIHWNLTGDWRTYEALDDIRRAWNRFGDSGGVAQIAGSAYVGLKLLGGIPGYEACDSEGDAFVSNAVSHASQNDDEWRDCTWFLGYGVYLADVDDTAIRQALVDWWTNSGGGEDGWGLYWHREAVAAVYWAAEGNASLRQSLYDELITYGTTENETGTTMDSMSALYQQLGVDGLFQCDLLTLAQAAVPGLWRAKDDLLQIQWDEPLSMAVIEHFNDNAGN